MRPLMLKKPKKYMLEDYFQDMRDEMNSLLKSAFENLGLDETEMESKRFVFRPPIELCEKDGHYELKAQLPGIKKEDIDVEVHEDSIKIKAEIKEEKKEEEENLYKSEFHYGKYIRNIPLPEDVISAEAEAEYKDGVLVISVPKLKKEEKEIKKITVK